jgi:hypothetical protein
VKTASDPDIRLKVVDGETGETKICDLSDAKTWDWSNQEIWRIIGGWQIINYDMLLFVARQKAERGYREIEITEAPRFAMLSGG